MTDIEKAIESVRKAILDEGPVPASHKDIMHLHRQEWPTLWNALDQLLQATKAECTCGYGGFHEPLNPRCERNQVN